VKSIEPAQPRDEHEAQAMKRALIEAYAALLAELIFLGAWPPPEVRAMNDVEGQDEDPK
jgi:hypothetical protein